MFNTRSRNSPACFSNLWHTKRQMVAPSDLADLKSQLDVEALISDVAASLAAAPDPALSSAIESALEATSRFAGADRSQLLAVRAPEFEARLLHAWAASGVEPSWRGAPASSLAQHTPWTANLFVTTRRPLVMSALDELPPEAHRDRAWFAAAGVRSAVWVPIAIGPDLRYMLSVEATLEQVRWPDSLVRCLPRLADIIGHAVERKRIADGLRETDARIALASLSAGTAPWDLDLSTGRIWAPPAARALHGFAADEEITFDRLLSVVHPEDAGCVRERLSRIATAKTDFAGEYRVVLPGGAIRWVALRGRARPAVDGAGPHILGMAVDVTARKLAEVEHRSVIARLEAAVDAGGLGFYLMTPPGETADLDDRMRALFGVPPEEEPRLRSFWLEHVHADDRDRVIQASRDVKEGGVERLSRVYRYLHPTRGLLWFQHTTRTFERDASGRPTRVAGVVQDITEQKRAEEELSTLSRRLIQAQEAERALLARELHDDVTQRMAVLAIDLGRAESGAPGGVQSEILRTVREGLVRLSEDIHSLAYRLHPSVLEELGLAEALRTECERRGRRGGIDITLDLDPVPAAFGKDAALCLYRVAQEALNNVIRHARAHTANVVLRQMDGGLLLAVRDDGVGFDAGEPRGRGSLGLVSMQERLRLVNGTLDVESAPAHGTSITAWVPADGGRR
jgi:PAS domain S-box-containing protein